MPANIYCFVPAYQQQVLASVLLSTHQLSQALWSKGIGFGISAMSLPDIADVRNMALSVWYDHLPQHTHLLFWDADMACQPDMITDMLLFDQPLVGCIYPKKTFPLDFVGRPPDDAKENGYRAGHLKVSGIGGGFMLIRRDMVTTMLAKMPEIIDEDIDAFKETMKPMPVTRLIRAFDKMPKEGMRRPMSEDYSFCYRWQQCGGEIWANVAHDVIHVGYWPFVGNYMQYSAEKAGKAQAEPVADASPWRVKDTRYGKMKYNINDTFIGRSLDAYGEWCQFELDLLSQIVRPGDTVIDVGANIGTHTVAFSRMVGPVGVVISFEPQPRLFDILAENVRINASPMNVQIYKSAVVGDMGASTKIQLTDLPPETQQANFGAFPAAGNGGVAADICTIDGLELNVRRTVRLIKIDVEGMEADVIYGGSDTIGKYHPFLYVENNGEDSRAIWEALEHVGYEALWSIGPYFNPNNFLGNKTNIWPNVMPSVNLICAPKGSMLAEALPMLAPLLGPDDNWQKASQRMRNPQTQAAE